MTPWLLLLAALVLVAGCGVFVAAEFSFLTVSRPMVEQAAQSGEWGAAGLAAALRTLSTQLSGAQVGITITNLAIGFVAEPSIASLLHGALRGMGLPDSVVATIGWVVAMVGAAALTMVFGELVPKNLALAHPYAVARFVAGPQRLFTTATRPLSHGLNVIANAIVRRFGVQPQEELASARSPEELVSLVRHSARAGVLREPAAVLLERALRFDSRDAAQVATPRTRMVTVEAGQSVAELIALARRTGVSRFPVCHGGIDNIIGLASLPAAVAIAPQQRAETPVRQVMTAPCLIPATLPLDDVLRLLRAADSQLGVLVDEFGGTAGVVTLEDLVEELVGDVIDEFDPHQPASYRHEGGGWSVSGLLRVDEVREHTGIDLPAAQHGYDTVAGLVLDRLGRLPTAGDRLTVGAVSVTVQAMDGRRIDRLHLRPHPSIPGQDSRDQQQDQEQPQ